MEDCAQLTKAGSIEGRWAVCLLLLLLGGWVKIVDIMSCLSCSGAVVVMLKDVEFLFHSISI